MQLIVVRSLSDISQECRTVTGVGYSLFCRQNYGYNSDLRVRRCIDDGLTCTVVSRETPRIDLLRRCAEQWLGFHPSFQG